MLQNTPKLTSLNNHYFTTWANYMGQKFWPTVIRAVLLLVFPGNTHAAGVIQVLNWYWSTMATLTCVTFRTQSWLCFLLQMFCHLQGVWPGLLCMVAAAFLGGPSNTSSTFYWSKQVTRSFQIQGLLVSCVKPCQFCRN